MILQHHAGLEVIDHLGHLGHLVSLDTLSPRAAPLVRITGCGTAASPPQRDHSGIGLGQPGVNLGLTY